VLCEAIARLTAKQRAVLVLRIFHELSFKEIGETMGSPLGTVKAHYHAAVIRLRGLLHASPSSS
jgi:RNA polymerase sigma-70 factor (ECF subfamily)